MDLAVYAIPAFIAFMVLEAVITRRRPVRGYEARDTAASLAMGVGNVAIDLAMKGATFACLSAVWPYRLMELDARAWSTWVIGLVTADFFYYWFHRMHHEVRFLWAAHVNHHSSEYYNLSTALRQSWTTPFTGLAFWLPMPLLGFSPALTLTLRSINTLYQFLDPH